MVDEEWYRFLGAVPQTNAVSLPPERPFAEGGFVSSGELNDGLQTPPEPSWYDRAMTSVENFGRKVGAPVVEVADKFLSQTGKAAREGSALMTEANRSARMQEGRLPVNALWQYPLGALQMAFSPVTGAAQTAGEYATKATGDPTFGAKVALAGEFVDPTHAGMIKKGIMAAVPVVGAARKTAEGIETVAPKRQLNDLGFYSSTAEVAESLKQTSSPKDAINSLLGKEGVKKDELIAAGIIDSKGNLTEEFAALDKVDGQMLAQRIREAAPEIKETVLHEISGEVRPGFKLLTRQEYVDQFGVLPGSDSNQFLLLDSSNNIRAAGPNRDTVIFGYEASTKYGPRQGYLYLTTPGGTNYREVNLHLPATGKEDLTNFGHFPEVTNPVVHIRMQDVSPPGSNSPTLRVEEIQSDWAQQGRKKRFRNPENIARYEEWQKQAEPFYTRYQKSITELLKAEETFKSVNQSLVGSSPSRTDFVSDRDYNAAYESWINNAFKNRQESEEFAKAVQNRVKAQDENKEAYRLLTEHNKKAPPSPEELLPHSVYVKDTENWTDLAVKRIFLEAAQKEYGSIQFIKGDINRARYPSEKKEDYGYHYDVNVPKSIKKLIKKLDPEAEIKTTTVGPSSADKAEELRSAEQDIEELHNELSVLENELRSARPERRQDIQDQIEELEFALEMSIDNLSAIKRESSPMEFWEVKMTDKMLEKLRTEGLPRFAKGGIVDVWNYKKNGEMYGKETVKDAPLRWKSAPDHPETHLAYITGEEASLLKQLDLHNSGVRYEDHFGPRGIPSYNGAGAGDSETGATAGGETGGPGPGGGSSTGDSGNTESTGTSEGNTDSFGAPGTTESTDTGFSGLYGSGDQGYGNVNGFSSLSTVGPSTESFSGSVGTQSALSVDPSTSAGFGFSGPESGVQGMNVGNAMADLGLGITSGVGFGPNSVTGLSPSSMDESGVAGGLADAFSNYDWGGMTFGPPAAPSAIGVTTSIPGYSMTNYSQQMTTPSQMSISPGISSTIGNPAAATSVGVMGPTGMNTLAGLSAIDTGLSALGIGNLTSPSMAPTATATAPSSVTAPSQTQATAPTAPAAPAASKSFFDAVSDRFTQAMERPFATGTNLAVSVFGGPVVGPLNTVSGLFGGPTLGGGVQSIADAIASGNFSGPKGYADTENTGYGEPGEYFPPASAPRPTVPSSAALGIASLSPSTYNISNFLSPGLAERPQPTYSSPIEYAGPSSISMIPGFDLGNLTGTYSYTPA